MIGNQVLSFAQRIRIRLFLEGCEVPVISAAIVAAPNSPSTCSLQIPPMVEATRLLPRTLVHLFFLDSYEAANPFLLDSETAGKTTEDSADPTVVEAQSTGNEPQTPEGITSVKAVPCGDTTPAKWSNRRYKLCFGGELVGFQWTKTPMHRSIVLQCEDFSNYWDYAYQWSNTGIFGPGMKALFSGGATNLFTDFLSSQGSVLASIILQGKCNAFPKLKGLAAGIVRLIEAIGGSYYTPSRDSRGNAIRKFAGQNIFFSLAELRLHITQMVAAYEDDPTSKRLLSRHGYHGMFNRALGGLGQQVSIRKAISAITKIMFHTTYAQPCPYYKPGTGTDPQGTRRVRLSADPRWSFFATQATAVAKSLEAIRNSVEGMKSQEVLTERTFSAGVRKAMLAHRAKIVQQRGYLQKSLPLMRDKVRGAPPMLISIYTMAIRALGQCVYQAQHWRPASTNYSTRRFENKLDEAITQLRRVQNLTVNTLNLKGRSPSRLVQQILRPDIWFGAPPRCNVLFPDVYEQLTYQRMFLQEPTRFSLKTNDEFFGEDFLFDRFYFAPQAGSLKRDQARLRDLLRRDLLDHELFTGILPVFEKMGEFNIFAARSNVGLQGKVAKVSFAQRSANFLYFKHRFNARQLQISGRFNPYVACGFPGLIVDRWVDQQAAETMQRIREEFIDEDPEARNLLLPQYTAELTGANFLANFTEVSHQISQAQLRGHTIIRCTYARQVDEGVEFLGVVEKTQTVHKRQDGDARRTTVVASPGPPALYSVGPNQGRITNVQDVTDKYVRGAGHRSPELALTEGQRLPVYLSGARRAGGSKIRQAFAPIGVEVSPPDLGPSEGKVLEEYLGSPDKSVTFRAYAVEEEVPRYRLEEVDLPAEELIRPGWYGDIWSPGKIGKVYRDFFGIGAITESTAVLDGSGGITTSPNEKFQQAVEEAQTANDIDEAVADAPIVASLGEGSSIQQAAEFLTVTYSYVKQAGLDADEFVRSYTWRPIATMLDIFGTEDLEFDESGVEVVSKGAVEGFHSRAFGPYEDAFGLVTPEIETLVGIKRGSTVAQKADPRKRRFELVQALTRRLSSGRAQLG